jgi:Cep192 domain 4/Abnormal spindle-like microcephaly-assoc'd, ASPM-SPD-2-Hydin
LSGISKVLNPAVVFVAAVAIGGCAGTPGATGPGPQIRASLSSVNFGTVTTGDTNSQLLVISNPSHEDLTVSALTVAGAAFGATGLTTPVTIGAGQSAPFDVVFKPTSKTAFSGSVSIVSNAANSPLYISLSGKGGAATHSLSISSYNVAFGDVAVGKTTSKDISLTNTGTSSVSISAVRLKGAGFRSSGVNSGLTLNPNQSATLSVSFGPTNSGAATGSISIASNAANSPQTILLSGTGSDSASPSVALSWSASSSAGVVGYNVYRGTVLGSYSKLNAALVAQTSYRDASVQPGRDLTYYYVVTAVSSAGTESGQSDPVAVSVP